MSLLHQTLLSRQKSRVHRHKINGMQSWKGWTGPRALAPTITCQRWYINFDQRTKWVPRGIDAIQGIGDITDESPERGVSSSKTNKKLLVRTNRTLYQTENPWHKRWERLSHWGITSTYNQNWRTISHLIELLNITSSYY